MACRTMWPNRAPIRASQALYQLPIWGRTLRRFQYIHHNAVVSTAPEFAAVHATSSLGRLPTAQLVRNLLLGYMFTSPLFSRVGVSVLKSLANPRSWWTDLDRNTILAWIVRATVYNHFCAGVNAAEVSHKITQLRTFGHTGVILCPGRETFVEKDEQIALARIDQRFDSQVNDWRDLIIETINMVGDGDFVGIKFSGAGANVTDALANGRDPPEQLEQAMDAFVKKCKERGVRLWIDAEQQALQSTIDRWAVDFMRKANKDGRAVVSNTYQAYLKDIRPKISAHLQCAQKEDWVLGIKLVRGAYIATDPRERIHDTKSNTDSSYNGIVRSLMKKDFEGLRPDKFPRTHLFLAGHNIESVRKAAHLSMQLVQAGERESPVKFGQLQGMADEVSCELLDLMDRWGTKRQSASRSVQPIESFKCLTWGSLRECMQFLLRRAVENRGAAERLTDSMKDMSAELKRRFIRV